MHDDTDILTGAELLAEIGLDPHAIRDILGDDETRIGHCPGWDMPAHHCRAEGHLCRCQPYGRPRCTRGHHLQANSVRAGGVTDDHIHTENLPAASAR